MQVKSEARIHEKKNRSGTISYRVDLGKVDGKRKQKTFSSLQAAEEFKRKADVEIQKAHPLALADFEKATRYEVLSALEKLRPYKASIGDAVSFFLKHAKPASPEITLRDAANYFLRLKIKKGSKARYLNSAEDYFRALITHFKNCNASAIDYKMAEGYIYDGKRQWNATTRRNHLRHGVLLFNFLADQNYLSRELNPFAKVPKPQKVEKATPCLSVADTEKLLQLALDMNAKEECAFMVLVLFCGVRVEEVAKMDWTLVRLDEKRIEITAEIAKKNKRRSNDIADNAIEWLKLCASEGPIAPRNYGARLRKIRKAAGIDYKQNAMRHSFASYHVAAKKDAAETAMLLGHPNAVLLYNTYRNSVPSAEAKKYWEIIPEISKRRSAQKIEAVMQLFGRNSNHLSVQQ